MKFTDIYIYRYIYNIIYSNTSASAMISFATCYMRAIS